MLTLTIDDLGDVVVFHCAGRLVAGTAALLRDAVLRQPMMRLAVLDLAEITAVDAAGLGTLVSMRTWAVARGARIKLLNLTPRVEEVLQLTQLDSLFEVCSVRDIMDIWCRSLGRGAFVPASSPDLVAGQPAHHVMRSGLHP